MYRFGPIIVLAALSIASCGVRPGGEATVPEEKAQAAPIFDPLATAEDRQVVPEAYPLPEASLISGDTITPPGDRPRADDSASEAVGPQEVFRVQIYTSRLYAEASREKVLAQEIFNLPIYLDYEVPYYKLRIGDFASRIEAENLLPEVRSIGYANAWVARVIRHLQELPPMDTTEEPILPSDSTAIPLDTLTRGPAQTGEEP